MFTKTKGADSQHAPTASAGNPTQEAIRSASSKPAARTAASLICSDMKIVGSVTSDGALQIDGKIEGDVSAQDIVIGASGVISGEVIAEVLVVKGTIKGSIRARKVELETGAKVEGDIIHTSLSIQPNAVFEGQVKHAADPLQASGPKPAGTTAQAKPAGAQPQAAPKPAPAPAAAAAAAPAPSAGTPPRGPAGSA